VWEDFFLCNYRSGLPLSTHQSIDQWPRKTRERRYRLCDVTDRYNSRMNYAFCLLHMEEFWKMAIPIIWCYRQLQSPNSTLRWRRQSTASVNMILISKPCCIEVEQTEDFISKYQSISVTHNELSLKEKAMVLTS
jgi:hypothetical protein